MKEYTSSRAAQLVAAFDLSGIHRVGTPGDFASGEWLENEAGATGAASCHEIGATDSAHASETMPNVVIGFCIWASLAG
jgi:hypothetical protein